MSRVQVRPTAKTKKRRRRRRTITLLTYILVVFGLAWYFESQGTTTIIFVRHADVADPETADRDQSLTVAGRARAEALAETLARIDVVGGVNAIYASPLKQSQQTAAPLAKRLGLDVVVADPTDIEGFINEVLVDHKREIVLIVTQAEVIAPLVEELHGSKNIAVGPAEYGTLYIVTIPWWGKVKTLQLPYAHPANGFSESSPSSVSAG